MSAGVVTEALLKIFQDNKRTVKIRMQEEAVLGLVVEGASATRRSIKAGEASASPIFVLNIIK